jgi:hypothetical protein
MVLMRSDNSLCSVFKLCCNGQGCSIILPSGISERNFTQTIMRYKDKIITRLLLASDLHSIERYLYTSLFNP